jgi:phosphoribosylanthranilate isomerase
VTASVWVKICGVTRVEDAIAAAEAGADAIGLNFVSDSPRAIDEDTARAIVSALGARLEVIGVVADLPVEAARDLRQRLGLAALQLHGDEAPELVRQLLPAAYKAVRVGSAADVELARRMPGERVLTDARVAGALGGTGARLDLSLVGSLCRQRSVIVAGGLTPETVAAAVAEVTPYGVDVASGVELPGHPREKDKARVANFVRRARGAA